MSLLTTSLATERDRLRVPKDQRAGDGHTGPDDEHHRHEHSIGLDQHPGHVGVSRVPDISRLGGRTNQSNNRLGYFPSPLPGGDTFGYLVFFQIFFSI